MAPPTRAPALAALATLAFGGGCGHAKSGSSNEAAVVQTSAWCGVQMVSLTSNPEIASPQGWSSGLPIPLSFSSEFTADELAQINRALDTWEHATGLTLFKRDPTPSPETGEDFITLNAPLNGDVNLHVKDSKDWTAHTNKETGVLGTTVFTYSGADQKQLTRATVRYDYDNWKIGDTTVLTDANAADLESIALHETGHFLGLAHNTTQPSVMTPQVYVGPDAVARKLFHVDVQNIRAIYTGGTATPADFPYAD